MQTISWSHSIALLHYCNTLIRFAIRLMIPSQNTPDTPHFWLANQIFHNSFCVYAFMYYHISSVIFCHICFTFYHYIYHWFIQLLCIFCMMNVVSIWQGNIVLRNISDVTEGVQWREKRGKSPFSKGIQRGNFPFSFASF